MESFLGNISVPMAAAVFALGYMCGTIPFGLIVTRMAGYGDIRKIGSGNIGATNVLRTGNVALALRTLLLDGLKGFFAIWFLAFFSLPPEIDKTLLYAIAGLGAVIGHVFPVWLKFRGGKGVATALGVFLFVTPWAGFCACLTWIGVAWATRYSSLAALAAIMIAPPLVWAWYGWKVAALFALASALVFARHAGNIRRLAKGEEPKISLGKKQGGIDEADAR